MSNTFNINNDTSLVACKGNPMLREVENMNAEIIP